MSLTRTTLDAAATASASQVLLDSITALAKDDIIQIGQEKMKVFAVPAAATSPVDVIRGWDGTVPVAHPITAGVVFGRPSDFVQSSGSPVRRRQFRSYTAAGAITLPNPGEDMVAVINGTGALAMTVANPAKDNDGDILIVVGNGKAAHTVEATGDYGDGGAGNDILTFAAGARNSAMMIAANEKWVLLPSLIGGTATDVTATIA